MGPPKHDICLFIFLLFMNLGPLPKNSGLNPISFQFLIGGTLGPRKSGPPLEEILATPLQVLRWSMSDILILIALYGTVVLIHICLRTDFQRRIQDFLTEDSKLSGAQGSQAHS